MKLMGYTSIRENGKSVLRELKSATGLEAQVDAVADRQVLRLLPRSLPAQRAHCSLTVKDLAMHYCARGSPASQHWPEGQRHDLYY
jgi:hypothetical protein